MKEVKAAMKAGPSESWAAALCAEAESIMNGAPGTENAAAEVLSLFKGRRFAGTRRERWIRLAQMTCSSWLGDHAGMKRFAQAAESAPGADLPELEGVPAEALCALYRTAAEIGGASRKGEERALGREAAHALWDKAGDAFFFVLTDARSFSRHGAAALCALRAVLPGLDDTAMPYALAAAASFCEEEMLRAIRFCCKALDEIRAGRPFAEGTLELLSSTLFGALYSSSQDEPAMRVPKRITPSHSEVQILSYFRQCLTEEGGDAALIALARTAPKGRITGTAADLLASSLAAESLEKADASLLREAAELVRGDDPDLGAGPLRRLVRARIAMQSGEPGKAARECDEALKLFSAHSLWGDLRAILLETGAFARIRREAGFTSADVLDYCRSAPVRVRTAPLRLIEAHSLLNCAAYPDLSGNVIEARAIAESLAARSPKDAGALSCLKRCLIMMHLEREALEVAKRIPRLLTGEQRKEARAECRALARTLAAEKSQAEPSDALRRRFLDAVERGIGPVVNVIRGWYPIEIWIVRPRKRPHAQYAVTFGVQLFAAPGESAAGIELAAALPGEKDLSGYRFAPHDFWPLTEMAKIAVQACREEGKHLEEGLTVHNADGSPLGPGAPFTGTMLCGFGEEAGVSRFLPAKLLALVPLYPEEVDFVALFGPERLRERLAGEEFLPISEHRRNVCLDRRFRPLIARNRLKAVCPEKGDMLAFVNLDILTEGKELRFMVRHRPEPECADWDSGWHFYTGEETEKSIEDKASFPLVDLNTIANYAPDIVPLLDAPYGSSYVRKDDGTAVPLQDVPPVSRRRRKDRLLS